MLPWWGTRLLGCVLGAVCSWSCSVFLVLCYHPSHNGLLFSLCFCLSVVNHSTFFFPFGCFCQVFLCVRLWWENQLIQSINVKLEVQSLKFPGTCSPDKMLNGQHLGRHVKMATFSKNGYSSESGELEN